MLLDGKIIIVTGAGTGIGHAAALLLAEAGATVVLAGTKLDTLESTATQIKAAGGKALIIRADVGDEHDVEALVARTIDTFGRLDGAFNNAGVPMHGKPLDELTSAEWG